jgi:hypothetical protein
MVLILETKRITRIIYPFYKTMLENLSPLLSRFSDVALGSQRQVNEMQMILNDLEYSLF